MILTEIPLLAPHRIHDLTPAAFMDYVRSMHKAPAVRAAKVAVELIRTKTGKPSVRVRGRTPPYVMQSEFLALCKAHGVRQNELFIHLKKRGISVTRGT